MTTEAPHLVTIGNISIDKIKIGEERARILPGGSAAAVALAAATYGVSTGVVSKIGRDFKETWFMELKERGVHTHGIHKHKNSCRFDLIYDKHGKVIKFNEMFNAEHVITEKHIPEHFFNAKHIHLSAAHPKNQAKFIPHLRKNSTISLTLWPAYESEYSEATPDLLKRTNILFCNNHEAKMIAKEDNIYDAVKSISKKGPEVVVLTKGAKGAAVYSKDKFTLFPSLRSSKVDTTGCGDAFAGGFLAEYLKTRDVSKAGWVGTSLASFTMSKMGAWFPRDVTLDQINQRVDRAQKYSESNVKKGSLMDFF